MSSKASERMLSDERWTRPKPRSRPYTGKKGLYLIDDHSSVVGIWVNIKYGWRFRYYDQLGSLESKIPSVGYQIPFRWNNAFDKSGIFASTRNLSKDTS